MLVWESRSVSDGGLMPVACVCPPPHAVHPAYHVNDERVIVNVILSGCGSVRGDGDDDGPCASVRHHHHHPRSRRMMHAVVGVSCVYPHHDCDYYYYFDFDLCSCLCSGPFPLPSASRHRSHQSHSRCHHGHVPAHFSCCVSAAAQRHY